MQQKKGFIKYFVIIIVILAVVFLSQQAYTKKAEQNLISATTNQSQAELAKGSNWVNSNIISKITGDTQKRGETIKTTDTKDLPAQSEKNVSENILQKVENYFSGITNSVIKPGTPQNCPAVPTPSK